MRGRIVGLVVLGLIVAGGAAAQAQDASRPLMVNEIRAWCDPGEHSSNDCDAASYGVFPDGSISVIFNYDKQDGHLNSNCTSELRQIPDDVHGWAYVIIAGEYQGAGTPEPAPTWRTGQSEADWRATVVAWEAETFPPAQYTVISLDDLRSFVTPDASRLHPDAQPIQVCELIVSR